MSRIANSPDRYPSLPLYRTGDTWRARYRVGSAATYLVRDDDEVAGPFPTLDVAESGGGYLDLGSSMMVVPCRPAPGQMALLHKSNGVAWMDWQTCEERPRAYAACGHLDTPRA